MKFQAQRRVKKKLNETAINDSERNLISDKTLMPDLFNNFYIEIPKENFRIVVI